MMSTKYVVYATMDSGEYGDDDADNHLAVNRVVNPNLPYSNLIASFSQDS